MLAKNRTKTIWLTTRITSPRRHTRCGGFPTATLPCEGRVKIRPSRRQPLVRNDNRRSSALGTRHSLLHPLSEPRHVVRQPLNPVARLAIARHSVALVGVEDQLRRDAPLHQRCVPHLR